MRSQGTHVVRIISSSTTPLFKLPPLAASKSFIIPLEITFPWGIITLATRWERTHNHVPGKPCLRPPFNANPCRARRQPKRNIALIEKSASAAAQHGWPDSQAGRFSTSVTSNIQGLKEIFKINYLLCIQICILPLTRQRQNLKWLLS